MLLFLYLWLAWSLCSETEFSPPSTPAWPVRVCQLHGFSAASGTVSALQAVSVNPEVELLSSLPVSSTSSNELPSSLPQEGIAFSSSHFILFTPSSSSEAIINPHRIIWELWRRKGVGWGVPSFYLPGSIQGLSLHLQALQIRSVLIFLSWDAQIFWETHWVWYKGISPVIEHTCFSFFCQREQNKITFPLQSHRQDTGAGPWGCWGQWVHLQPPGHWPNK